MSKAEERLQRFGVEEFVRVWEELDGLAMAWAAARSPNLLRLPNNKLIYWRDYEKGDLVRPPV